MKKLRMMGMAALLSLGVAACDEGTSPLDPGQTPEGEASFGIVLAPAGAPAAGVASAPPVLAHHRDGHSGGHSGAFIPLESVESIVLPVGRVEAKQASGGGGWIEAGFVGADVDLLNLPLDGLPLLETSLPEGDYSKLRVFLTAAPSITLLDDVVVGRSTFEAGTHPLVIPSVENSGFKVKAEFSVGPDGQVLTILFDEGATVARVQATGAGVLKIAPVLDVRADDGESVGGFDEEEEEDDDGENRVEFEGWAATLEGSTLTLDDGTVVEIGAETGVSGDLLTLEAVAEALANGEAVEVEGEGELAADGTTIVAHHVEFEVDDDDGDGDVDDEDGEAEFEGEVTAVDRAARSLTLRDGDEEMVVLVVDATEIEGDFETFEAMADAFDAGEAVEAEAKGTLEDGALVADEVEFEVEDQDRKVELEGTVAAASASPPHLLTLVLEDGGEVRVRVNGGTDIEGDLASWAELVEALAAGAVVEAEVEGIATGDHVLAKKLELELVD